MKPEPIETERWRQIEQLYQAALELAPTQRAAFLDQACGSDAELRQQVESLLRCDEKAKNFIETPALEVAAQLDAARAEYLHRNSSDDVEVETEVERLLQVKTGSDLGGPSSLVGRSIAHYAIERRLGAGGMGEVYLARDRALGRMVALKLLPADFHPAIRERLLREAWASAHVQHPGIATFYDAGHAGGVDYIAMEYVSGQTLRDRLRSGPLPPARGIEMVAGLLEALVHAHHARVIHRDIKPENIILTAEGKTKLLDFGLAKGVGAGVRGVRAGPVAPMDTTLPTVELRRGSTLPSDPGAAVRDPSGLENLTRAGTIMGTVGYMAPEQIRGEAADEGTDIFAVGAVLYEAISGKPAFPGRTTQERLDAIAERDPDPLVGEGIPAGLDTAVRRALARDRDARYPSASAFLAALREAGGPEARSPHPATLAILDFWCPSGDPSLAALATTLIESLGAMLDRVVGLSVVPRMRVATLGTSVQENLSPAEIGLRLGCSAVLTGLLQADRDAVRLGAQLTDVATGYRTATESLSGSPQQVTAALERLAAVVAHSLGAEPAACVYRPSLEAAELYARGRRLARGFARGAFDEARDLLERAVALHPGYAAALVPVCAMRSNFDDDPQDLVRAVEYARRAVAIDSTLSEAYLWGGYALFHQQRWAEAQPMYRRAMELDPSNFLAPYFKAGVLFSASRFEELEVATDPGDPPLTREHSWEWCEDKAIALYQRALQLNPLFMWAWLGLGWHHLQKRRFGEARWCLGHALELEPKALPSLTGVAGYLGECLRREGRLVEARAQFLEGLKAVERTDHMYRDTLRGLFLCGLGRAALDEGDVEAAHAAFSQATLHLRGRPKARCGGQVIVQALAGLARSGGGDGALDEALNIFEGRRGFNFSALWGCNDGIALWDMHLAARGLGREDARDLLRRAREAGSSEAHRETAQAGSD